MRFFQALLVATTLLAQPAAAQNYDRFGLTPNDVKRLSEHKAPRAQALDEAKATKNPKELETLNALMVLPPLPIADARELTGEWRCRSLQIGGNILPLAIYGYFNCKITGSGAEARFQKMTGSQLSRGDFIRLDEKTFVFRGVFHIYDRKPETYGAGPKTDLTGLVYRVAPDRLRIELPAPYYESRYDVMELVRRK
jgi:hypothetical protein